MSPSPAAIFAGGDAATVSDRFQVRWINFSEPPVKRAVLEIRVWTCRV
jgi:hypothetical protein